MPLIATKNNRTHKRLFYGVTVVFPKARKSAFQRGLALVVFSRLTCLMRHPIHFFGLTLPKPCCLHHLPKPLA